ncbi:MAG: hypothetical protein Q8K30_05200 [Candidatus Gracilibacteria bacterium]|nr:hypothetical protein [Candidatus Gracilibacteria bacterium]
MIKKLLLVYITILITFNYQSTNSYDKELSTFDDGKTIKELKESIDILDKANSELVEDYKDLNIDFEVKKFLRTNLSELELSNLKNTISIFNTNKLRIENDISNKIKNKLSVVEEKKSLIEEKRKFFNGLISYINSEFNNDYLNYIKENVQIFIEQKKQNNLEIKKEILNSKLGVLETKIQEHKNFINENIKKIIESKLDEKLKNLSNNETFKALSKESKVKVLNKTIDKINQKLDKLKNSNISNTGTISKYANDIYDKKVQTFMVAMTKLENFRDTFK